MKVQFNLPSLFRRINSGKYQRIGGASIRIEEITRGVNRGALLIMFPPTGYNLDIAEAAGSWLSNFAAWCLPYRKMRRPFFVHAGFMEMYRDVREYLYGEVNEYMERWAERCGKDSSLPEHKIIVTGYSQGAALATIAHEDLFFHGFDVCSIVLASPRVFVGVPKKRFKNLHRLYVMGDVVTRVPFWPYTHVGKQYKLGERCMWPRVSKHTPESYTEELEGINFDEARG